MTGMAEQPDDVGSKRLLPASALEIQVPAPQPITQLLSRLWRHISPRRRRQFWMLLVLMILSSFAEIISIGAVIPFLGVLSAPGHVFHHSAAQPLIQALGLREPRELLLPFTIGFGAAAVIAGAMRLLLLWANTRLSLATGTDISISIYHRTLYQPYAVHVARNSSEVISGIASKTDTAIYSTFLPTLTLISSGVILSVILVALLYVEPVAALVVFGGFGLIYAVIIRLTRGRLLLNSQHVAAESTRVIKALQEGLSGIRDVLIDGSQDTYCQIYRNADRPLRQAQGNSLFISESPRYAMEALGMLIITALAYSLAQQPDGIANAIPILGTLALGAQRLLPVLQQAYRAWSSIQSGQASLHDTLALLDQPMPDYADRPPAIPLPFGQHIRLRRLSFRYSPQAPWILKGVDLTITRGSRVGFIGTTGSGKSTLLDLVMGLLQPSEGTLEIDGEPVTDANNRAWQAHIAHVPQAIFLADSSIEENIAFGIPRREIDHDRVRQAANQAQIADIIETWDQQYQTIVGEHGVRLSGGQRQRIGIARALYKQTDVIVFDEATSALDSETEHAVMQTIESLSEDVTILVIAHRLSTLRNCTQVVELRDGGIKQAGTYRKITGQAG